MGEAKQRGSYDERREEARSAMIDEAEVLIALIKGENSGLQVKMLSRDETPDQESVPVIVAWFLNANMGELAAQAIAMYRAHKASEAGESDAPQSGMHILTTPRLAAADGTPMTDAKAGAILGPDEKPLH